MTAQEFTGERYIPGEGGARIAYEHVHRYLFAARRAHGKRVLDVATGVGYGAALLARSASSVIAMDLDGDSVHQARHARGGGNLSFFRGDARQLPLPSGSVDLVVAFEVLEHLADQEELVREIARVCDRQGAALISTPNKAAYSDARGYSNPFHVREFCRDDFLSLLGRHFPKVELLSQNIRAGSLISGGVGEAEIITDPVPGESAPAVVSMYFLAVCSHGDSGDAVPAGSAYLDLADGLICEYIAEVQRLGSWGKGLEESVKSRDQFIQDLQEDHARQADMIRLLQGNFRLLQEDHGRQAESIRLLREEMERERGNLLQEIERLGQIIEERDQSIRQHQKAYEQLRLEFDDRGRWAKDLESRVADRDALLGRVQSDLQRVGDHLARIRHHRLYRILCRIGLLPK